MSDIIANDPIAATFSDVLDSSSKQYKIDIPPGVKEYLIFILMKLFANKEFIEGSSLHQDFHDCFRGLKSYGETGDKWLMIAGLYPESLKKRWTNLERIVQIGSSCYRNQSKDCPGVDQSKLYKSLSESFLSCVRLLNGVMAISVKLSHIPIVGKDGSDMVPPPVTLH